MNSLLFAFLILLLVRFICLKEGQRLSGARFLGACVFFALAPFACYESSVFAALLAVLLIIPHALLYLGECRSERSSSALRAITLVIALPLVYGAFAEISADDLRMGVSVAMSPEWAVLLMAALLCLKESNFVIRWFFRHNGLIEKVQERSEAPSTENGRIIGNLERLLLLLFLWEGLAVAATLIVAVKGLARFKMMEEDQSFAEYVIIGTFLSVLLTVLIYKATHPFG